MMKIIVLSCLVVAASARPEDSFFHLGDSNAGRRPVQENGGGGGSPDTGNGFWLNAYQAVIYLASPSHSGICFRCLELKFTLSHFKVGKCSETIPPFLPP